MQIFLETERLKLRPFTDDDVENLVELDSDPDVMRFINGGRPTSRGEIENEVLPTFLGYYDRSGLKFVRTFHQPWPDYIEGEEEGDVEYALLRSEWERPTVEDVASAGTASTS